MDSSLTVALVNTLLQIFLRYPLAKSGIGAYKGGMASNERFNLKLKLAAAPRAKRAAFLRSTGLTWQAVGDVLKVSRQRAQQLAAKAPK